MPGVTRTANLATNIPSGSTYALAYAPAHILQASTTAKAHGCWVCARSRVGGQVRACFCRSGPAGTMENRFDSGRLQMTA